MKYSFKGNVALVSGAGSGIGRATAQLLAANGLKVVASDLTLEAAPDVNPDAQGRASPVAVRFYALKAPGGFESADYFSLQDRDTETLGADMVLRKELVLRPGDKQDLQLELDADRAHDRRLGHRVGPGHQPVRRRGGLEQLAGLPARPRPRWPGRHLGLGQPGRAGRPGHRPRAPVIRESAASGRRAGW